MVTSLVCKLSEVPRMMIDCVRRSKSEVRGLLGGKSDDIFWIVSNNFLGIVLEDGWELWRNDDLFS